MDTAGNVCKIDGIRSIYINRPRPKTCAMQKGLILNLDSLLISHE